MRRTIRNAAAFLTIFALIFAWLSLNTFAAESEASTDLEEISTTIGEDGSEGVTEAEAIRNYDDEFGAIFSLERVKFSFQVVVVGMLMVVAVLTILWIIFAITGKIFNSGEAKEKKNNDIKSAVDEVPNTPIAAETQGMGMTDAELTAVITAAIAATIGSGDYPEFKSGFRVVSFKKTENRGAKNRY